MLGSASVISTGSARRGRGNCALSATGIRPSAVRLRPGTAPALPRSAPHGATARAAMQPPSSGDLRARSGRRCALLGRLLLGLLEPADLGQRLRSRDVRDRAVRALGAVVAGRLPPSGRGDFVLLAEQCEEDLRLLRAEAGQ